MSEPVTLPAFVAARLDEDEREAKYAIEKLSACAGVHISDPDDDGDIGHIVAYSCHARRHDPARVLREVAVKRRRLALYLDAEKTLAAALKDAPPEDNPATAHSYVRERINVNTAAGRFTALETSVRLDAMAWSGHPEFRQEWVP